MSIFEIGQNQSLYSFDDTKKVMDKLTQQLATGKKINSSGDDPVLWAKSQQDAIAVGGFKKINDNLNLVATSIHTADAAMEGINSYIEQMKTTLDAIIKNYPPFPVGSQDRIRYLKMFNGLKQQIDSLSAPDDQGANQIIGNSTTVPGDWTVPSGAGSTSITIHKQDVSTGTSGLNISELPDTASDADVAAARANLDAALVTLTAKRSSLGADAAAITRSQGFATTLSTAQQTDGEMWTSADMNEASANYKSIELKNALALQSISNLTNMQSQLLDLLK